MDFRKADKDDLESLVALRIAYLKEDYGQLTEEQILSLKNQLPGYFKTHLNKDLYAYAALENEEIISIILMLVVEKPANPNFITGKTGTLINVYTKPKFRRKGIANKLLKMAVKEAENLNLSFIDLKATKDGYHLYLKNGFVEEKNKYTAMKYRIK